MEYLLIVIFLIAPDSSKVNIKNFFIFKYNRTTNFTYKINEWATNYQEATELYQL